MEIKKITEKITLPVAIVIAVVILGIAFYAIQYNKQQSAELKLKHEECESLSDGARKRWSNVIGVTYDDEFWKECVVTYTDTKTGEVETSPLRPMRDVK